MNSELVSKISRVKYVWVVLTHQLGRSWPNLSKFLRCKEGGEFLYKQSSVQVCFGMPEFAVPYNQQKCSRAVTLCIFVLCSTIMFNGKSNLQLSYTKMVKYSKMDSCTSKCRWSKSLSFFQAWKGYLRHRPLEVPGDCSGDQAGLLLQATHSGISDMPQTCQLRLDCTGAGKPYQ